MMNTISNNMIGSNRSRDTNRVRDVTTNMYDTIITVIMPLVRLHALTRVTSIARLIRRALMSDANNTKLTSKNDSTIIRMINITSSRNIHIAEYEYECLINRELTVESNIARITSRPNMMSSSLTIEINIRITSYSGRKRHSIHDHIINSTIKCKCTRTSTITTTSLIITKITRSELALRIIVMLINIVRGTTIIMRIRLRVIV